MTLCVIEAAGRQLFLKLDYHMKYKYKFFSTTWVSQLLRFPENSGIPNSFLFFFFLIWRKKYMNDSTKLMFAMH